MSKNTLAAEVKRLIRERKTTFQDIAEEFNESPSSLRAWSAKNQWPQDVIEKLVEWMGPPMTLEYLKEKFEFRLAQTRRKYSSRELQEDALTRLLPLLKPLAASGYQGELTADDVLFLFRVQTGLGQGLSPAAIKELLGLRHPPSA